MTNKTEQQESPSQKKILDALGEAGGPMVTAIVNAMSIEGRAVLCTAIARHAAAEEAPPAELYLPALLGAAVCMELGTCTYLTLLATDTKSTCAISLGTPPDADWFKHARGIMDAIANQSLGADETKH